MTPQCKAINVAFKVAEQAITTRLIKKKALISNAYWGRVKDDGMFPLNRGTVIKGIRLGRILVENNEGWSGVAPSDFCSTEMCNQKVPEIVRNGLDDYTYSFASKQVRTDWFCINDLAIREIADEEINHIEDGLRRVARFVWEEFLRTRYNNLCDQKFLFKLPELPTNDETLKSGCQDALTESAYIFELRPAVGGAPQEIDENFIRVNCDPDDLALISELTLDGLDVANERLQYEDEAYVDIDIPLLDVILAALPMGKRFAEVENIDMNNAMSYGGLNITQLKRKLGTAFVARDQYSMRYDVHAMRFYEDNVYNTNILPGFGAFDATNPQTWPRFVRSYPYIPIPAELAGVKFVYNDNYRKAPFGISTVFTPQVIEMQAYPEISGYGGARKGKNLGYAGSAEWFNPDWPCNEDRELGFWKLRFGAAIKPWMTEQGYSYFHRINRQLSLAGDPCALAVAPCEDEIKGYCYAGTAGSANQEAPPIAHHQFENVWL